MGVTRSMRAEWRQVLVWSLMYPCCGCMQAQLKEAQGATAAEAAKLAELQQRLDGVEAERSAAQDALAASRQEAATAQDQLAEARKQVRCCSGQDGH